MNIEKSTGRWRLAVSLLGAAALAGGAWWLWPRNAAAAAPAAVAVLQRVQGQVVVPEGSPLRRTLRVEPVAEQQVSAAFSLPAVVEADPARLVKILSPVAGRIQSLDKVLGDAVKRGDALAGVDAPDLMQARSDAQKARAALVLARQALARQRELAGSEIASRRDVEQAENDAAQAASELARAEARLAQIGAATTGAGQGSVLSLRSPIAGRVVELNAARGGYWNDTNASLMTVADLSSVYVSASVDEKDLGSVFVGQEATVLFDAYPDQPMKARVRYVGELLDPDTRKLKVRLLFDNRDGRLRPGMFARATFLARPHGGLLLPAAAVVHAGFDDRVFVESAPWRFEPRVVRLGVRQGEQVEVVSGLKAGERVVQRDGVLLDD